MAGRLGANNLLSMAGNAGIVFGRFDKRTLEFPSDSNTVEPQCGDPGIPVNEYRTARC